MAQRNQKQEQKPARASSDAVGKPNAKTNTNTNHATENTMNEQAEIQMIPLNKLHISPRNVRKRRGGIEALAGQILAAGRVIQNLVVLPERIGRKQGFGVVAGGRRFLALSSLLEAGKIKGDFLVPCAFTTEEEAHELSLAENVHREDMHPADEFQAWAMLADEGKSVNDIAARHGVKKEQVRQRLKLGSLSPVVLEMFRNDQLTIEQAMALTLTADHETQEAIVKARKQVPPAWQIREQLTAGKVSGSDARVKLVGAKAYEKAGGVITSDLFNERGDGRYYENVDLLQRLALEKLETVAGPLREKLAFVDVVAEFLSYGLTSEYCAVPTYKAEPDAATAAKLAELDAKLQAANKAADDVEWGEDDTDEKWEAAQEAIAAVEKEIEEIEAPLQRTHPDAHLFIGALVGIDRDGKPALRENIIRAEDKAKLMNPNAPAKDDKAQEAEEDESDPNSVRSDLSTYLTAVTQEAMAENVPLALRSLAYHLALRFIDERYQNHGVRVSCEDHARLPPSETLAGSKVEEARQARHQQWADTLPGNADELWAWCQKADDATISKLLAYSVARSTQGTQMGTNSQPMTPVVKALGINMADHWQPNAGYFKRIRKAVTVKLLADHGHTDPALAKMKRDALADRAAELMAGTGWLPPTLSL